MYFSKIETQKINNYLTSIKTKEDKVFIVFVPESELLSVPELVDFLIIKKIEFIGGVFPGIIVNDKLMDKGV
ncbi:MAG: hypothetical protein U9R32_00825, partial [Bacteroidota bacterium]|nr:hypothetical protein [Bacteroidota bacterium]